LILEDRLKDLTILRRKIDEQFSQDEVKELAYYLGINPYNLGRGTKLAKIGQLIRLTAQSGRLPKLIELLEKERPHTEWSDVAQVVEIHEIAHNYSTTVSLERGLTLTLVVSALAVSALAVLGLGLGLRAGAGDGDGAGAGAGVGAKTRAGTETTGGAGVCVVDANTIILIILKNS
jgi:hypothetical protein